MPNVLSVCGSLRAGSFNSILLATAEAEVTRLGGSVERYTAIAGLPRFDQDLEEPVPDAVAALRRAVLAADGVLIATPTYNHAITGALKDWIDWLSRPPGKSVLAGKPVAIITSSIGPQAGSPSAEYLERITRAFRAQVVHPITSIAHVHTTLDEKSSPDEPTTARVNETAQALMLTVRGAQVVDNEARSRHELVIDGNVVGYSQYRTNTIAGVPAVELFHTVTEPPNGGQGMAAFLTRTILDRIAVVDDSRCVIASCHFVADYIAAHPKYLSLLASTD